MDSQDRDFSDPEHRGFADELAHRHQPARAVPSSADADLWAEDVLCLLFPQRSRSPSDPHRGGHASRRLADLEHRLAGLLRGVHADPAHARIFFERLPDIDRLLQLDARATFEGDPAAHSLDEVILCYPGFLATAFYRFAHALHALRIPLLPRVLTEAAHQRTGIDIHPGAEIGPSFCIDHGTGVVIGETSSIGAHVKIYQGVTLGALSVSKALAARKRHPTIQDHVVIYAQAAILGGETVIGHHSVIGGNVWLTHSIPPHSVVMQASEHTITQRHGSTP